MSLLAHPSVRAARAPRWPALATAGLCVLAAVGMAAVLLGAVQGEGLKPAVAALAATVLLLVLAAFGSVRRFVVCMVFFTAALDMNKAILPPMDRFYVPGLYVTVSQALLLLWALLWGFDRLVRQRRSLPFTTMDGWALAFLAVVWWGALRAHDTTLALASAMAYTLCVLGYYMASHGLATPAELRLALRGIVAMFVLQALFVGLQMAAHAPITLPGIKVATGEAAPLLAAGVFRPVGLFNHPNVASDYELWLLLPALALALLGRGRVGPRTWCVAVAVAVVATGMLLASLSRGGWLAALLGVLVLGAVFLRCGLIGRSHVAWAIGLAALGLVAVALVYPQVFLRLTEPDGRSTESRVLLADQALMIIREQPWLGVGFGGYNRAMVDHLPASWALVSSDYHKALLTLVVHNQYLLCAAELGVPACLLWVALLVRSARQAWPLRQWRQPVPFALATGLAAAVVAHMLYLASDNYYVDIRIAMLWLALGVLQALVLQARGRHGALT